MISPIQRTGLFDQIHNDRQVAVNNSISPEEREAAWRRVTDAIGRVLRSLNTKKRRQLTPSHFKELYELCRLRSHMEQACYYLWQLAHYANELCESWGFKVTMEDGVPNEIIPRGSRRAVMMAHQRYRAFMKGIEAMSLAA